MGREKGTTVIHSRPLAVRLAMCLGGLGALAPCGIWPNNRALANGSAGKCTNPPRRARWPTHIHYERRTGDSYPARLTRADISWRDASDGGNYTLNRRSGDLTVVVASSTGGYFLHDQCKLD